MDDKRYAQLPMESIVTWAEGCGVADLPHETAKALAADATYRLRELLHVCSQFMRHCKRRRLTPDDVNRALKWMDVGSVFGYSGSEPVEWQYIPEVGVHITHDPPVNLASTALSGDIFHQPGSAFVRGEWVHVSGHSMIKGEGGCESVPSPLALAPELHQYYQTLMKVIVGPSNDLFKVMQDDLACNPSLGPLVGALVGGIQRGVQRARQKPFILRRLLLVIRALLRNPNIHLGPQKYIHDMMNALIYCIVTERKSASDTQMIRSLASCILLQVVARDPNSGTVWETAVSTLGEVLAGGSSRPWGQHVGALAGLLTLGASALHRAVIPIIRNYHTRLAHALGHPPTNQKDVLDIHTAYGLLLAGMVNIMATLLRNLPDVIEISFERKIDIESTKGTIRKPRSSKDRFAKRVCEIYSLGAEMFGDMFVLQVPRVYLCRQLEQPEFLQSSVYRDAAVTGETLLAQLMNPKNNKQIKGQRKSSMWSSVRSSRVSHPSQVFENYKPIQPRVTQQPIQINVRGFPTRTLEQLNRSKTLLPTVIPHPHRPLLVGIARSHPRTGRMPHATYTWPLKPKLQPGYTLQYLIL
ncbi:TAF6-like RNA polymerase II p300/CBP-associated factor-associated factor 65 kDa subunit 6L isoform X2 [Oratosquilla oratoria]|uniref:TAF6-like RNA polymerase II p300/CBP-associated factor-associated factor 65 kDa subunit 6L isoform X2 n=1 Tax=Oratosquilla oratoria TaxID=337810 RepID=UPI003F76D755